ncbi:Pachytene checkpoint protein 2 [Cichlidogyrus casuarinus]|uniref:Pachytene checkpoint protein 2 n=1 Tax=Cichlidogyrus casuarinus TaxID=1844966 RepID=A0ABD2PW31_9PLAT
MDVMRDITNIDIVRENEGSENDQRLSVILEVSIQKYSLLSYSQIMELLDKYLKSDELVHIPKKLMDFSDSALSDKISENILHIYFLSTDVNQEQQVKLSQIRPIFHLYRMYIGDEAEPVNVTLNLNDETISFGRKWLLPNSNLDDLWDSLVFEKPIKEQLISYSETALLFADKEVSTSIISWNRMILLHGPPGTGKTTLCQALANKLAIRLNSRYDAVQLFEISTENLLSKWFSESAKFVAAMFSTMEAYLDNPKHLICLLVDEVESLVVSRNSSSNDPSDSLRVVNSMLTHIDRLRRFPNVLIMTTSNVTGVLDSAFLDRADLRLFIGNPTIPATYSILRSCLSELCRVGIIREPSAMIMDVKYLKNNSLLNEISKKLAAFASKCQGLSGRSIRKLPLLAHSFHIPHSASHCSLDQFIEALNKSLDLCRAIDSDNMC